MESKITNNWRAVMVITAVAAISIGGYFYFSNKNTKYVAEDFRCPEDYKSPQEYTDSLARWISESQKNTPEMTLEELLTKRYDNLVAHGCKQTLLNIGRIEPTDSVIKFLGKEFGPYVKEFDYDTNVYSVFYPLRGQKTGEADEEIIFNFYFKDVWAKKPITAKLLAEQIADSGLNIENKFQAPDPINKEPAFFFAASSDYSEQGYGYVFFMKVASFGENVYSITLSKKISGYGKELQDDMLRWMADNIKSGGTIGDMGPGDEWVDDFRNFQQK